jgi:hypothetical protein
MTDKTPQERAGDAYFAVTKAYQDAEQRYREKSAQIEAEYLARIEKLNRRGKWIDAFFVAAMAVWLVCIVYITVKVA